ncbi:MAG: cytochrome c oxidase, subunit [Gemmatimonadetes bacterium]|nr:cytochrome c oxidase, subunit [Gemmatimonadota bacterium]
MHSFFDPASPQARAVAGLWWWMFGVGMVIWFGVFAVAMYAARQPHGQRGPDDLEHVSPERHRRMERVVAGAVFATILILCAFLVYDFSIGSVLAMHPKRALTIDVVGHQWWWEITYEDPNPSKRVGTANEIHVPVGELVQFKLRAADVIHSIWAPNLGGKKDLIPGYVSTLWFKADTAGVYRGQCTEFCGMQHAQMAFYIVAEPPVKFAGWLAAGSIPNPPPTDSLLLHGRDVFMQRGCASCHSIGGTDARATVGPDLTHFKGRAAIAAGSLSNTRANLTRWIQNPSALKPGVRMPALELSPGEMNALVSYLETLK